MLSELMTRDMKFCCGHFVTGHMQWSILVVFLPVLPGKKCSGSPILPGNWTHASGVFTEM
jgi:hypothetical protein